MSDSEQPDRNGWQSNLMKAMPSDKGHLCLIGSRQANQPEGEQETGRKDRLE